MDKQILRKEISIIIKDGVETVKNEYHKQNIITDDENTELLDYCDDDWEDGYLRGVCTDNNGEIIWIDIDKLFNELSDYFKECDIDEEETVRYHTFKELKNKIEKWKGFTLWI